MATSSRCVQTGLATINLKTILVQAFDQATTAIGIIRQIAYEFPNRSTLNLWNDFSRADIVSLR